MTVFVKCASRRARERLFRAMGRALVAYWSWDRPALHGYYEVADDELPKASAVKGVTKYCGDTSDLARCWA